MEQIERKFYETEAEFIADFMSNMKDENDASIIKSLVYQNMILFSRRARKFKSWYFVSKYVSFISPLAITTITSLKVPNSETIIVLLSLLASIAIGISGIGKFREHWIRYRFYCEQLKLEVMRFSSDSGVYDKKDSENSKVNTLCNRIAKIFISENTEWVDTLKCDDSINSTKKEKSGTGINTET
jgi:hypothetical protein